MLPYWWCCAGVAVGNGRDGNTGSVGKAGHVIGRRAFEQFDFRSSPRNSRADRLSSPPHPSSISSPQPPLTLDHNGFPAPSFLSEPGSPESRCYQCREARQTRFRLPGYAPEHHPVDDPHQWPHGTVSGRSNWIDDVLMGYRSLLSTRHGRRPPLSVCGSMPEAGLRPTRPTELRTSSSTLPSRYITIMTLTRTDGD